MYAVPLIFRLVNTIKFKTFPIIPRAHIMGNTKPYDNFRSASVLGSSCIYGRKKKVCKFFFFLFGFSNMM